MSLVWNLFYQKGFPSRQRETFEFW